MKLFLLILLAACFAALAQTTSRAPRSSATPEHFRWSEMLAHELDYKHTVRNAKDLSLPEKDAIILFIFHQMVLDGDTEGLSGDMTKRQIREYAESVRVEVVDLKGDGTREILAQAPAIPLCGATGNCSFWVFEFAEGRMRVILDNGKFGNGYEKVIVRPWFTNGYKDIVLGAHISADDRALDVYQYRTGMYRVSACYGTTMVGDTGQFLDRPAVFSRKCE
ncbi:MAG: hypothetical protein ACLQGT_14365 [Terracidiphilus sp.]